MSDKHTIVVQHYLSPCGILLLGSFNDNLCLCDWRTKLHSSGKADTRLKRLLHAEFKDGLTDVIMQAQQQLDEYFAGKRHLFTLPLLFTGTDFQKAVWHELLQIPFGSAVSYKEIAGRISRPKAVRAVANAVGANPLSIIVPCHRVIGNDRSLTGYGGGLTAKRKLLQLESISYLEKD